MMTDEHRGNHICERILLITEPEPEPERVGEIQGGGGIAEVTKIDATAWVNF